MCYLGYRSFLGRSGGCLICKQIRFHDVAIIGIAAEVVVGKAGGHAATWRALDEAFHDEERLIDLLNGTCVLADGGGDGAETNGTATELIDDGQKNLVIDFVKAILVDVQRLQGDAGDALVDAPGAFHLSEVAHAT